MALGEDSPAAERSGWLFGRRLLRHSIGPSNPLYSFHLDNCIQDIVSFTDDFHTLDGSYWDGDNGDANWAVQADQPEGVVQVDCAGDQDGVLVCAANQMWINVDHRPVILGRLKVGVVANSKFEFGFATETDVDDGVVGTKATPTSGDNTNDDYVVVIRDTDDDTSIEMVSDNQSGEADGPTLTVPSGTGITAADDTWLTIMVACNEQDEARYWVNGQYMNRAVTGVPNGDAALTPWIVCVDRDAAGTGHLYLDYVKMWQERSAIS